MAYTRFNNGFEVLSNSAIDKRFLLTKEDMLHAEDDDSDYTFPETYFAVCIDDDDDYGKLFIYNIKNSFDSVLGKFRPIEDTMMFNSETAIKNIDNAVAENISSSSAESSTAVNNLINQTLENTSVDGGLVE